MDFNDYQEKAHRTALYLNSFKEKYSDLPEEVYGIVGLTYCGLGLGEAGETQNKLKKLIRDTGGEISEEFKQKIVDELGDILWYIAEIGNNLKIKMNDIALRNLEKLFIRKENGTLKGDGDKR